MDEKSYKDKVVLAIGAHPDDIDFMCGGSIAKMVAEGASAYQLVLTSGDKGSNDPEMTREKLTQTRREEQKEAGKIIGFKEIFFLSNEDTNLKADQNLKKEIVRYIRKLKPDIVFSWDPSCYYSLEKGFVMHTDHRAAGEACLDAVFPLARDKMAFQDLEKEGLHPHKVKELLLINFNEANFYIDISDFFSTKIKAVAAHQSQFGPQDLESLKKSNEKDGKQVSDKYAEKFVRLLLPA